jgi:3-phenylpropionate/trans-cinnamate dioxygenase ferredoxin reductase component
MDWCSTFLRFDAVTKRVVIVGASHSGIAVAVRLRALDPAIDIIVISAEAAHPYQRPALSKAYLSGKATLEAILLRPPSWFEDNKIELLRGVTITSINRVEKIVALSTGQNLTYDTLVLATGAEPRRFPSEKGGALRGVYTVRDLADADALKNEMVEGRNLVVIGGGYIGLEAASEASKKSIRVTVLEAADRIVKRVACAETSDHLRALHQSHGVNIREAVSIRQIIGENETFTGVELESGEVLPADFVIVGIGIAPCISLAEAAGLYLNNGIAVGPYLQTSDPNIYAVGDCASFPRNGAHIRLESVQNANDQGAVAAANILGQHKTYQSTPWFWSDQFDLKLQIAGLNTGYDDVLVIMGNGAARAHLYFCEGRFISADCFNDAVTFVMARKLLDSGTVLTRDVAASANFSIKDFVNG